MRTAPLRQIRWSWLAGAALIAGCSSAEGAFKSAEALEAEGKLEQAAAAFEHVCAVDPRSPSCAGADARASAARARAADKALADGQGVKAAALLRTALLGADEARAKEIADRLASPELTQAVLFERAAADPDKKAARKTMESVAASSAPAAGRAKEWLARERPAWIVEAVKAACGPRHDGSCSTTWADLQALPAKPPGFEEVKALAEEEERRVYPARVAAEALLEKFAKRQEKEKAGRECAYRYGNSDIEGEADRGIGRCWTGVFGFDGWKRSYTYAEEDSQFRRHLKTIADPDLVASLEKRRATALEHGVANKQDVKKPEGGAR